MVYNSSSQKDIILNILYCGLPGAGKRANIRSIFKNSLDKSGADFSGASAYNVDVSNYTSIGLDLGYIKNAKFKLNLFAVDINNLNDSKLLAADGLIYVADCFEHNLQDNMRAVKMLFDRIERLNCNLDQSSIVFQYSKVDSAESVNPSLINSVVNVRNFQWCEANTQSGYGVIKTLKLLCRSIVGQRQKQNIGNFTTLPYPENDQQGFAYNYGETQEVPLSYLNNSAPKQLAREGYVYLAPIKKGGANVSLEIKSYTPSKTSVPMGYN